MRFIWCLLLLAVVAGRASAQTLHLGNDTTVCNSFPFVIDAGPGFIDYQWSTGQSSQSIVANNSGEYKVTVTDTLNNVLVDSIHVTIHSQPIAVFLGNNLCLGTTIPFANLTRSTDSIVAWLWKFDDGTTDTTYQPSHLFATAGNHINTLIATTAYGCIDSVTNPLTVYGLPHVVAGPKNDTINIGDSVQLNATTQAHTFTWQPNIYLVDSTVINPIAVPLFTTQFTLSVTDSLGCANMDSTTITVNQPPTAKDDILALGFGVSKVIDVQANDNDPNHYALTTTILLGPYHGTATVVNGDSIQYSPNARYSGSDTIVYQVCNTAHKPQCAQATVYISIAGVAPVAAPDTITTLINTVGTVNVLANDSDAAGKILQITEIGTPLNGSITDLGNGVLSYTPNEGFYGADSLYYIICDNGSPVLCDSGHVYISVVKKDLKISNSFSPNGDGVLDYFVIEGITAFPNNHLLIFSRWGEKILEQQPYNNSWNGKRGFNEDVADGIYFYTLDLGDGSKALTGWIMLKR